MSQLDSSTRTASELLFETYLQRNGLTEWEFEPNWSGNRKKPDYLLRWNGEELLFEVKQRDPRACLDGYFDPYKGTRTEIGEARKKFKEFRDYCCCLVIVNEGDPQTILEPEFIFGAMLGDLGFRFPILDGIDSGRSTTIDNVFLPQRGKMVYYKKHEYENTRIAAVIALAEVRLRNAEFRRFQRQATVEKERTWGRQLSSTEKAVVALQCATEYVEAGRGSIYHRTPRVVVCENPGARMPLPREMFCGPFDERWAIVGEHLRPVYAGVRVREIENPPVSEDICPTLGATGGLSRDA